MPWNGHATEWNRGWSFRYTSKKLAVANFWIRHQTDSLLRAHSSTLIKKYRSATTPPATYYAQPNIKTLEMLDKHYRHYTTHFTGYQWVPFLAGCCTTYPALSIRLIAASSSLLQLVGLLWKFVFSLIMQTVCLYEQYQLLEVNHHSW